MQIGYNNEIEFEGVLYHIQTEDHGLDDGRITSQIFRSGQILETITVSYQKAIAAIENPDVRNEEIRKRMKALHSLCFRNVRSGKYIEPAPTGPEVVPEVGPEAEPKVKVEEEQPAEAPNIAAEEVPREAPTPPPSGIIKPVTVPPDTFRAPPLPSPARTEAVVAESGDAETRNATLEMDSPDLRPPPELDSVVPSSLPDELEASLEIEELPIDQLSASGLFPVDEVEILADPSQTHVDEGPVEGRFHTSSSGVVYDRAVRAFRGIDLPTDDSLLTQLRALVQARVLRI